LMRWGGYTRQYAKLFKVVHAIAINQLENSFGPFLRPANWVRRIRVP
jgi:hypothetical protein